MKKANSIPHPGKMPCGGPVPVQYNPSYEYGHQDPPTEAVPISQHHQIAGHTPVHTITKPPK